MLLETTYTCVVKCIKIQPLKTVDTNLQTSWKVVLLTLTWVSHCISLKGYQQLSWRVQHHMVICNAYVTDFFSWHFHLIDPTDIDNSCNLPKNPCSYVIMYNYKWWSSSVFAPFCPIFSSHWDLFPCIAVLARNYYQLLLNPMATMAVYGILVTSC